MAFELPQQRVDDPAFLEKFLDTVADELEELATSPDHQFSDSELDIVKNFREHKKLPREHLWFHNLLVRVGQDFRLTPDEIEVLRDKFLE